MKIGVDIHGVIDKFPELFSFLTRRWTEKHEVHIITGQERSIVEPKLEKFGIAYNYIYSIVDYHISVGTKMWKDDKRGAGWWLDKDDWIRSKGNYALDTKIDIHFDDEVAYARFFPQTTTVILVRDNFDVNFVNMIK